MDNTSQSNVEVAPAYIKTVRVPLWVVKASSYLIMLLGIGAIMTFGIIIIMLFWCVAVVTNQSKQVRELREYVNVETAKASEERLKANRAIKKAIEGSINRNE